MKLLKNERGVALVTALLLTLISLAIIMALLYMITWQTQLSAAHRRYKTAIEASHGGVEIFTKQVIPYIFTNNRTATSGGSLAASFSTIGLAMGSSTCLKAKLNSPTSQWGAACSTNSMSPDPTIGPDTTFRLAGTANQNFKVYAKIVDTIPGNSDLSGFELLDSGAGVAGISSGVSPKHMPAMYRLEVQGEKEFNPQERAKLSVLYAY
jgi:hypothetical protein